MTIMSIDPTTRPGVAAALATQGRAKRQDGEPNWRPLAEVGARAGLAGPDLRADARKAERQGLIKVKAVKSGPRVALTELGRQLFGLDGPGPGLGSTHDQVEGSAPRPPLVQLLIRWGSAVAIVEELADHLGRDIEDVWDRILELERLGTVETWPDHPAGPAVMLSSRTAAGLGIWLSSDGSRWLRPHDPDPTTIEPVRVILNESDLARDQDRPGLLDAFPDPRSISGLAAVEAAEDAERLCREIQDHWSDPAGSGATVVDRELTVKERWSLAGRGLPVVRLPNPKILLGQGLAWPVLAPGGRQLWRLGLGVCPGCRDRVLDRSQYCLVCCRSGLDDLIRYLLSLEGRRKFTSRRAIGARPGSTRAVRRRELQAKAQPDLRGGLGG